MFCCFVRRIETTLRLIFSSSSIDAPSTIGRNQASLRLSLVTLYITKQTSTLTLKIFSRVFHNFCYALAPGGQSNICEMSTSSSSPSASSQRQQQSWTSAGKDAVAGALSGAFARTVTAPIERVKLILQLQNSTTTTTTTTTSTTTTPHNGSGSRTTAFSVTKQIIETEGIWAFWRGNLQNVIRAGGQAALNFALMDYYKGLAYKVVFVNHDRSPSPSPTDNNNNNNNFKSRRSSSFLPPSSWLVSFVAGGLAGGTATTVLYPTEFLRTRLALDHGRQQQQHHDGRRRSSPSASALKAAANNNTHRTAGTSQPKPQVMRQYRGMIDATKQIVKVDGIAGLYQGYGISLFGSIIYRLLYLGGYDVCKTELIEWKRRNQHILDDQQTNDEYPSNNVIVSSTRDDDPVSLGWTELFWLAQFVSLTAGTICYPIDSVRRRMMMQAGKPIDERLYLNSLDCFWKIWTKEGLRGFYLGIGPNLIRSFGGALALVAYDGFKTILQ